LFNHIIVFENFPVQELVATGITDATSLTLLEATVNEQTSYDMAITVTKGAVYELDFDCNGCLYNVSQLDRVFEHLERIISAALADPSVAALSVNLLSEAEQRQL